MKTTIYELLGMIKDDKAPKKIMYKNIKYTYEDIGYYNKQRGYLFDGYYTEGILDDEVEILETTITYKPDKIEKLNIENGKCVDIWDMFCKINEIIDVINKEN